MGEKGLGGLGEELLGEEGLMDNRFRGRGWKRSC